MATRKKSARSAKQGPRKTASRKPASRKPAARKAASRKPATKPTSKLAAVTQSKPAWFSVSLASEFLLELEPELAVTRRCIERMPSEHGTWKPHPRSSAMGHLTQLLCKMVGVLADIPKGVDLDLARGPGYSFETTQTLLADFDRQVKRLHASLGAVKPDDWGKDWSVRAGDQVLSTSSRKDAMRNTINHLVHHRGQLTVYLRLNEVPIPQLYGPTADER